MKIFYDRSFLKACFYFALAGFMAMFVLRIIIARSPAADLAGMEQNVVYTLQHYLEGEKLYRAPDALPFAITQYTPLYYYVCGLSAEAAGLDPDRNIAGIYLTGRIWSLIFNILLICAVFMISRKLGSGFYISALAALCSFIFLYRHDFSIRADSMHDALALWSVYFFIAFLDRKDLWNKGLFSFAAMLFAVLAIFAKQSGILMPMLILSFLFLTGNFKGFLKQGLLFVLLFGGLTGLFYMRYGETFFDNVIGGVANGINVRWFVLYILDLPFFIKVFPLLIAVAVLSLYRGVIFKAEPVWRFLAYSSICAFLFAAVTALKMGSSIQYFTVFQTLALVFILNFLFSSQFRWADDRALTSGKNLKGATLVYFSILIALNVFSQYKKNIDLEFRQEQEMKERQSTALKAAAYVDDHLNGERNRYVFVNLGEERLGITNALFRNCATPQLDIFQASTKPLKIFDYDYFEECMETGVIKYLIEYEPEPPFKITSRYDRLKSNYRLVSEIGAYSIFEYHREILTKEGRID